CMEMRGNPFLRDDPETRRRVEGLNRGVMTHYGHAGPIFVQWLLEHRVDWDRYREEYRIAVERFANLAPSAEGGRLGQYAAAISVAAALAHAALDLPWEYRDPLESLWTEIAAEATDAAGEARALCDVMSWAYSHKETFFGRHLQEHESKPRPSLN